MMTDLIAFLNTLANSLASALLAPVAWLPGWLSLSLVAAVTGALMLLVFKYTSNQEAIRQARNQIKANLLALSLYRDSVAVSLRAQLRILIFAGRLMCYSLVPMLVMTVPTCLLLGQLALWYQVRPLEIGEEAVVTVKLSSDDAMTMSDLTLVDSSLVELNVGPVRVPSKRMVCWSVKPVKEGSHDLTFEVAGQRFRKQIVIGEGYMQASIQRPAMAWSDLLMHPLEPPFPRGSIVQSIDIAYPSRASWVSGSTTWLPFWFVVSMVAAFAVKPLFNVNI